TRVGMHSVCPRHSGVGGESNTHDPKVGSLQSFRTAACSPCQVVMSALAGAGACQTSMPIVSPSIASEFTNTSAKGHPSGATALPGIQCFVGGASTDHVAG